MKLKIILRLAWRKKKFIGNLKFTQSEKDIDELNNNIKKFLKIKNMVCIKHTSR